MILITYASWYVPGKGEIPVIYHLADKKKGEIDMIVLFWDDRRSVRKAAKDLNNDVHVVYVDELKNRYIHTIRMLKHSIGFPKVFPIASDKKILHIRNTKALPFHKEIDKAFEENLVFFEDLISGIRDHEKNLKAERYKGLKPYLVKINFIEIMSITTPKIRCKVFWSNVIANLEPRKPPATKHTAIISAYSQ